MQDEAVDMKEMAIRHFGSHQPTAEEQTRISLFLLNLKQANTMALAKNEFQMMDWLPYAFLHKQYYRELELATLLNRSTNWSLNPFIYAEAAQASAKFWLKTEAHRYMMGVFSLDRTFFEYLALSHAFMSEVRFIPLFPADYPLEDRFYAALYAVENENGRQIQTQIRFLKEMELPLSRKEKEKIVNEKRQIVADLFCDLLASVCRKEGQGLR